MHLVLLLLLVALLTLSPSSSGSSLGFSGRKAISSSPPSSAYICSIWKQSSPSRTILALLRYVPSHIEPAEPRCRS